MLRSQLKCHVNIHIHVAFTSAADDVHIHTYKLNTKTRVHAFVVCRLANTTDVYDASDAAIVQRVASRPRSSQSERRFLRVQRLSSHRLPGGILLPLPGRRFAVATQIQRLVNDRNRRQLHLVIR